jgi:hypothetical protein
MILVGIYTGVRLLSEEPTLRWADVGPQSRPADRPAAYTKSGRTRTVPLDAALRRALTILSERSAGELSS